MITNQSLNQFQDSSPSSVTSSQGAQLTSMNLTSKNSSSVPSSPGTQEPDVTASQAKMSKPEIITLIAFAVMTIATLCLWPAKGRHLLAVDTMAVLMFSVTIMFASGIIHNKTKMVTRVAAIVLAVLIIVGLALATSGILHF